MSYSEEKPSICARHISIGLSSHEGRAERKLTRQIAVKVGIPRFLEKGLIDSARATLLGTQGLTLGLRGRWGHSGHGRRLGRDALWLWLLRLWLLLLLLRSLLRRRLERPMTSDSRCLHVRPRKRSLRRRRREVGGQSRVRHGDGFVGAQLGRRWEERGHDSPAEQKKAQEAARPVNGINRRRSKESWRGGKEGDGNEIAEERVGLVLKFLLRKARVNNWKAHGPLLMIFRLS
jgi:hypothetical protein